MPLGNIIFRLHALTPAGRLLVCLFSPRNVDTTPMQAMKAQPPCRFPLDRVRDSDEQDDNLNTTIVLDRDEIEKEHDQIMENNGIVNSASKNLRDVWTR